MGRLWYGISSVMFVVREGVLARSKRLARSLIPDHLQSQNRG